MPAGIIHQISTLHPAAQAVAVLGLAVFCCIGLFFLGLVILHIYKSV